MKIVQIIPSLIRGGAEKFVVELCNGLAQFDDVTLYLINLYKHDPDNSASFLNRLDSKVQFIDLDKKSGFNSKTLIRLTRLLKTLNPDIVHTHINAFEYINLYRLLNPSCNFFHTIHSIPKQECPNPILKYIRHFFYKKKNHYPVCISEEIRDLFFQYYNFKKGHLVYNGTFKPEQSENFHFVTRYFEDIKREYKFVIVNVARILPLKNQVMLAQAVNELNTQQPGNCKLLLIGMTTDLQMEHQLRMESAKGNHIDILGVKSNIGDYLLQADGFCLSSTYEGLPISLLEAMSLGCVPLCTKVGGIPNVIKDNYNGLLADEISISQIKQMLLRFVDHPNRGLLSENAKLTYKEKFTMNICAGEYYNLYKKTI